MAFRNLISYILLISLTITIFSCSTSQKTWYKGNLHTHSLWSDGDDYPEMIMDWYKSNGYHFIGLSDHNILQEGEKWIKIPDNPLRRNAFQKYLDKFGAEWVESREVDDTLQVRLKTLAEYAPIFSEKEKFLILKSEEITASYEKKPIHLNATNIAALIEPKGGNNVVEVVQNNIDAVLAQRDSTGQPMFPHINHPNFGWAITVEEMMQLKGERFFEVFNGHPSVNNYGDSSRIGTEVMWDQINLHYLQNGQPLMYGLATDDSHNYHLFGPRYSNTGRGWVMVNSTTLSPEAIVKAMEAGDFYATTGVEIEKIKIKKKAIQVKIKSEPGVQYTIQFIGVPKDAKESTILMEVQGNKANYRFKDEWFVRARVLSSKPKINPFQAGDVETAWIQPVVK